MGVPFHGVVTREAKVKKENKEKLKSWPMMTHISG
jgi:hypothetical protein